MDVSEILSMVSTYGGISTVITIVGGVMYYKKTERLKEAEAALAEANVSKAKTEGKSDEFNLYKEMVEHWKERAVNAEKKELETVEWWRGKYEKQMRRNEEQTAIIREQRATLACKDEQLQAEKDLNTDYERCIAELSEENTYLSLWACHKAECDNGIPPRGRLKGMTFDVTRLVKTGSRLKSLENKHINLTKQK